MFFPSRCICCMGVINCFGSFCPTCSNSLQTASKVDIRGESYHIYIYICVCVIICICMLCEPNWPLFVVRLCEALQISVQQQSIPVAISGPHLARGAPHQDRGSHERYQVWHVKKKHENNDDDDDDDDDDIDGDGFMMMMMMIMITMMMASVFLVLLLLRWW